MSFQSQDRVDNFRLVGDEAGQRGGKRKQGYEVNTLLNVCI